VADSTIIKKCKWLFVNVPGYKSTFSTATEFLNSYRDGTSASVFWDILLDGSYGLRVTTLSVQDRCNSACTKHLPYASSALHQHTVQIDSVLQLLSPISNKAAPE